MCTHTTKAMTFLILLFAVFCLVSPESLGAMERESPVSTALGDKFASDIDQILSKNDIKSIAVFGFISQNGQDRISEAINGLLPNEMTKVLNMHLTNLRKYKVMPTGLVASRRQQAKMTIEMLEDKSAVQAFLGDDYEVMIYGYVVKGIDALDSNVKVQFTILKIINGEVTPLRMGYESYKISDDPITMAYLGENFPPLFITKPNGEVNVNPSGMLGGEIVNDDLISVYVHVNGERLPFYQTKEKNGQNMLTVALPMDCEYAIELFDRNASLRGASGHLPRKNVLGAAVLVDGIGTLGNWLSTQGQPSDEDFMLCENPVDASKWVLAGIGHDSYDDKGVPGKSMLIEGWQTSMSTGRRFKFGKTRDSLAAKTNQISANLGIITVVVFKEAASGRKGEYATGQGAEFGRQIRIMEFQFDPEPVQVINIRCLPVGASGDSGEAGEDLLLITR